MNWKSVKDYPLPRYADNKVFLVEYLHPTKSEKKNFVTFSCGPLSEIEYFDEDDKTRSNWAATHWLEIEPPTDANTESAPNENKPAEFVSSNDKDVCKSDPVQFVADAAIDEMKKFAATRVEPSWEERFRWETAALMMSKLQGSDLNHLEWPVMMAEKLIAELKKGRGE